MFKRVLVVDDENELAELLTSFFIKDFDLNVDDVVQCSSVPGAQELLANQHFDLIFLDFHLGRHNGLELIPDIRELTPRPKVVLMSGSFLDQQNSGIDCYLLKPFRFSVVKEIIKGLFSTEED